MKIKAAVVDEMGGDYQLSDVEIARPQGKDILVKIVATGICRSDYAVRHGRVIPFPVVLGHEGSGIVEEVGELVTSVKKGDHVVLSYGYCNDCRECDEGHPASCSRMKIINYGGKNLRGEGVIMKEDGTSVNNFFNQSSFATYSLVDETNIIKVEKDIDLRLLGPLTCGLATGSGAVFNALKPNAGSTMAVFGTGAVGFAALMAAKIVGCTTIIAVDIHQARLDLAKELGATHTINSGETKEDVVDKILELTGGRGVDYAIDTSGVVPVMKQALTSVTRGGSFVPLAITRQPLEVDTFSELSNNNKKIVGVLMGDSIPKYHVPRLIDFYRKGQFSFDKLVKFYPFSEITQAENDSVSGKVLKSILIMDESYVPPK